MEVTSIESISKGSEEGKYILEEIAKQEKTILETVKTLLTKEIDSSMSRALQDLTAVNRHLLSRVDIVIKKELKDQELIRILQETQKESDDFRQKCMYLEEDCNRLKARLDKQGKVPMKKIKSDVAGGHISLSEDQERPKFVIDEENKTISDIEAPNEEGDDVIYYFKNVSNTSLAISFSAEVYWAPR